MRHYPIHICRLLALALALCAGAGVAFAQETTGALNGTVTDNTGAVVKGATVTVTDEGKNVDVRTVTTGEEGVYAVTPLPAGSYRVTVEAPGFKKYVQTGVKVDVGGRRTVDALMEAGDISASTVRRPPTSTLTPVWTYFLKPGASTVTL